MSGVNPMWGLRPVRDASGTIKIKEVYYNQAGEITLIEDGWGWPYHDTDEQNIESLAARYTISVARDNYNSEIIDASQATAKWDHITEEEWKQYQEEQRRLEKDVEE